MTHRLLITGAAFENKGAEAMIRCVQHGIVDAVPDTVGLLAVRPDTKWSSEELRSLGIRVGVEYHSRGRRVWATLMEKLGTVLPTRLTRLGIELATGDDFDITAVVDISGYAFGDPWVGDLPASWVARSRKRLASALTRDAALLDALQVPFLYLPQCWGPFEKPASRVIADRVLKNASLLYARDRVSLEWLRTLPSFQPDKISLASDIAFAFGGAPREIGTALLNDIGIKCGEAPLIGIVPNMRVYERVQGEGPGNLYVRQLIDVARHFTKRLGCAVAVMPHEIKRSPSLVPDDRYLCEIIANAASDSGVVRAALGEYYAEELKAMIGQTSLLISSRFHSIVAAMSLRVPVVSIAWSHKYRELMDSVGLGEYVVDHDESGDASIVDLCDRAWQERASMAELLVRYVPTHETSAREVLTRSAALIQEAVS